MSASFHNFLVLARSDRANIRRYNLEVLDSIRETEFTKYLLCLIEEFANDSYDVDHRTLAASLLKNAIDAKKQHLKLDFVKKWLPLEESEKSQVTEHLLKIIISPEISQASKEVIAKFASIWPELLGVLLSYIHRLPDGFKQSASNSLQSMCPATYKAGEQDHVTMILSAIFQCMSAADADAETGSLHKALGLNQSNHNSDMEWDCLMKVVCEATMSLEVDLRQTAFEFLTFIASKHYINLENFRGKIVNITAKAIREGDEVVAIQAIRCWICICQSERRILGAYSGQIGSFNASYFHFAKHALPELVPLLLETLLKYEDYLGFDMYLDFDEDEDEDEVLNIAMVGGRCLSVFAALEDDIVTHVMPFFEKRLPKHGYIYRLAAVYVFGAISKSISTDKLREMVNTKVCFVFDALDDQINVVRDMAGWTISRISKFLYRSTTTRPIITEENFEKIVKGLQKATHSSSNFIKLKAYKALYYVVRGYKDFSQSYLLNSQFGTITEELVITLQVQKILEIRTPMYRALTEFVRCWTPETSTTILHLASNVMFDLGMLFMEGNEYINSEGELLSPEEMEVQRDLCWRLLEVTISKLKFERTKPEFMESVDDMMKWFMGVVDKATTIEKVMLAIGDLALAVGPDFAKYMPMLYEYLEEHLGNYGAHRTCATTVDAVGDICRALKEKVLPYSDRIVLKLLSIMSSMQLDRAVKLRILCCFGDIASAIKDEFKKYLEILMEKLQQAQEDGVDDGINPLRSAILTAYSGIFIGFWSKTEHVISYTPAVYQYLENIVMRNDMDDLVRKKVIELLAYLAYPPKKKAGYLKSKWVQKFINESLVSRNHKTKLAAKWVKSFIDKTSSEDC